MRALKWYQHINLLLLMLLPAIGTGFLMITSDSGRKLHYGAAHGVLIAMAVALSALLGYAAYRSYFLERNSSLRYMALGYIGFAMIYSFHGFFTPMAGHHLLMFVIYGPVSRLIMCIYVFIGLQRLIGSRSADSRPVTRTWWWKHILLFSLLALLAGLAAHWGLLSVIRVKLIESLSLGVSLLASIQLLRLRNRSGLLRFHLIAQLLFVQSSLAFILSSPWNALWWFAHAISAGGFMTLGYAIVHNYEATRSMGRVYNETILYSSLRSVLQTSHEGFIMTDIQGRVSYTNPRLKLFFGDSLPPGQPVDAFFHQLHLKNTLAPDLTAQVENFLRGETEKLQLHLEQINDRGEPVFYELYAEPVADEGNGDRLGYLFVFRNRSEEERLNQMKNEFIGIVSHELRTPIASILGFTEIMLLRDVAQEKRAKYLQTIHNETTRLSGLIDDFLDIQRMESGRQQYRLQPVVLNDQLREVAEQHQGKDGHTLRLELPELEVVVCADKERIVQVLHNLISNAIKYSPKAPHIDLSIAIDNGQAVIRVRDYGLGIPESSLPHLFKKFYRVELPEHRKIRGTGLGLTIVKEITEAHGGKVEVSSVYGEGTEFTLRLPLYKVPSLEGKLAIVEDDEGQSKLFAEALEGRFSQVIRFTTAEEALFVLERSASLPWLWIVDIQLEGRLNGWSFIQSLRQHRLYQHMAMVISTVSSRPADYVPVPNEHFLRKPFRISDFVNRVDELKGLSGAGQMLMPAYDEQSLLQLLHSQGIEVSGISRSGDFSSISIKDEEAD